MKASILYAIFLCSMVASHAQTSFAIDEALKQLYHEYDPAKKTAQWVCAKEQGAERSDRLCDYLEGGNLKDDHTVSVSVVLTAQVQEGDTTRIYLATSARPTRFPGEFDCHACIPATGAAVYIWQGQHWALESANMTAAYLGGWGESPRVDMITIGPEKHGLLLSSTDMAFGYVSAFKELLAPLGKRIEEVWNLRDEDDNLAAIDPSDKVLNQPAYRTSAAFRFLASDEDASDNSDYYDIEVISRGHDREDLNHPIKSENWTEVYTFKNGKYTLSRRTAFTEVKKSAKPASK